MSRRVNINDLDDKTLERFSKELQLCKESSYGFCQNVNYIYLYDSEGDFVYIPFFYGKDFPRPEREKFKNINVKFTGILRENQKTVKIEAIEKLNKTGSVVIAAACGFGKTSTSIYIACKIGLKTLILCHRIVLINQWKKSIEKFCPDAKVCIISGKDKKKEGDFYIMNASNVCKYDRNFFKEIGCVIVDEAHIIMAEKMSSCMKYLIPRYLIGLSATPYRNDGLNSLLDMYFGNEKIERKLYRKHTVYKVNTGIKIEAKLNRMGKIDWGSVLESQALNKERNELIIKIVNFFKERTFLILCKRVDQAKYILERLKEEKEDVTSLIGNCQEFEMKSRILVGTAQKTGVGFDHPNLNSLILASDIEGYFVQYLGRVFRREDTEPIIFDLLDNMGLLFKHFKTRNSVYVEHGGIVKDFSKEFPNFFIK